MAFTITNAFVQQFKNNVLITYQQMGSRLRGAVRIDDITGESEWVERLKDTAAIKKTTRHGDSPLVASVHDNRRVDLADYEWGDLIDKHDKVKMLIQPQNPYAMNARAAFGRSQDDELIAAFNGNAITNKSTPTTVAFPSTQKIVHGSAGLTLKKLIEVIEKFNDKEVPKEDRYFVYSPRALSYLLNDSSITSADYNTVKLLMRGDIDTFMGFTWIMSARLPKTGNIRSLFAWHKPSMVLGIGMDVVTRIAERADKSFSTYVYLMMSIGATRLQEEGVVEIEIDESVAL